MKADYLVPPVTVLLTQSGRAIYRSPADATPLPPMRLARPDTFLPVLLRMGEETWRRDHGGDLFGLALVWDPQSWTGFTVTEVRYASLSVVLLSIDTVLRRTQTTAGDTPMTLDHFSLWTDHLLDDASVLKNLSG